MTTYTSIRDYLDGRIDAACPSGLFAGDKVQIAGRRGIGLADFIAGAGIAMPSVLLTYFGFQHTQPREADYGTRTTSWSVFVRTRGDAEALIDALINAFEDEMDFKVGSTVYRATVSGGQYLLLDQGFDSYELRVEVR